MPLWAPKMNALFPNNAKVCSNYEQTNKTLFALACVLLVKHLTTTCFLVCVVRCNVNLHCDFHEALVSLYSWILAVFNLFLKAAHLFTETPTPSLKTKQSTPNSREITELIFWCVVFHLKGGCGGILPLF